ncbi:hypothetical protein CFP56_030241, partial [Quercus suber]
VAVDIDLDSPQPFHIIEQMKIKAQELRNKSHKKEETGNAKGEGIMQIRASKDLTEAKRILESNEKQRKEVKTWIATRKCICKTFHSFVVGKNGTTSLPLKSVTYAEQLRECLRSLKRNHQNDGAKVRRAFETLLIYVGNTAKNPNEEKFRKIRLTNPLFQ